MNWEYRLLAHQDELGNVLYFDIHMVRHDEYGNPETWTDEPVELMDGSPAFIVATLEKVLNDLKGNPPLLIQEDTNTLEVLPLISKEEGM